MDSNQIFKLIDSVLPLEVCLYHQVLPLARQEKRLQLGMVDPEDSSALDYARRMLSSLNCALVPQKISADEHKSILSAYLNYKGKSQQSTEPEKTAATATPHKENTKVNFNGEARRGVDAPVQQKRPQEDRAAPRGDSRSSNPSKEAPALPNNLPQLNVRAAYLSHPLEQLAKLSPQELLQELLARVLLKGIGRLYFERTAERGRVLWSQEGVKQAALEELPVAVFQGLIQEVKRLFNLSAIPVEAPKQVDMERLCGKTHLMLVLQVTPGERGEEATLQVLRGNALKFYKQQKVAELSQDALQLAQLLQRKLREIGDRLDPELTSESLETLPAINQMLESIDQQLQSLKTQQADVKPSESRSEK